MRSDIFHPDFKAQPWWWEAWTPNNALSQDPPARTDIAIVGAGYGGLATALELRRNGVGAVVLERLYDVLHLVLAHFGNLFQSGRKVAVLIQIADDGLGGVSHILGNHADAQLRAQMVA